MNPAYFWKLTCSELIIKRRGKRGKRKAKSNLTSKEKESTVVNRYNFPRFFYTNACSLSNEKLDRLKLISDDYDIVCITETWGTSAKCLQLENFISFETQRRERCGGGTAIFVRNTFPCSSYRNYVFNNNCEFEITWTIVRPSFMPKSVTVIAIACVYFPPNIEANINQKLYKSLLSAFDNIKTKYVSPAFMIFGDFNKWKFLSNFTQSTGLSQIISFPTFFQDNETKKGKLDKVFSSLKKWYELPKETPPLKQSSQYHIGIEIKPIKSFASPHSSSIFVNSRNYNSKAFLDFTDLMENINWSPLYTADCIDFKVSYMNSVFNNAFEVAFPIKIRKVNSNDRGWVNNKLKQSFKLIKKLSRNSDAYKDAIRQLNVNMKRAKQDFNGKIQYEIEKDHNNLYKFVNRICGLKNRQSAVNELSVANNTTDTLEMLNSINLHFSKISNTYEPLGKIDLVVNTKESCLQINELNVLKMFDKISLKKSNVPGALPVKFLKQAAVHIVPIYTHIINFSYKNYRVPTEWKKGFITPLHKDPNNLSIDNLRPITQTNVFSKIMENFMYDKLYKQIIDKIDINQYGTIKKSSTSHYLVSLYDFILKALDTPNTYVIIVLLDLSKAFDLVHHRVLIDALVELDVKHHDIYWIIDFLKNRKQCTKDKDTISEFVDISNSVPQGTKLAPLLFIVLINRILNNFKQMKSDNNTMKAFVDDMCVAEAVSYGDTPKMNECITYLNNCLTENKMVLNAKKSNIIVIDKSKGKKFSSFKCIVDNNEIPKVEKCKLLGVYINSNCDWSDHVNHIYEKANKKLYIIRKLKGVGLSTSQLVKLYVTHIRSLIEYCSVLWAFNINKDLEKKLNSIEKRALSIIMSRYVSKNKYDQICHLAGIDSLEARRFTLLKNFGLKLLKNDRLKHWLNPYIICRDDKKSSRYNKNKFNFRLVKCKYERYRRSTIPTLVKYLRESL